MLQLPDLAQGCHNIETWIRDLATFTRAKQQNPIQALEGWGRHKNNEYFEVTYERHASKSGVQQKKGNKKEISIGTILPTRQIAQCLFSSTHKPPLGHLWEGWISHVGTIPQDAILPPVLVPSVNRELLNSCRFSVAAFQTGIQQNFCTCVILHI